MTKKRNRILLGILTSVIAFCSVSALQAEDSGGPNWRGWSDAVFDQAKKEHRLVLLDLEAVWCHWCHVMGQTTYRDPKVLELLKDRFVAVQVDQDARPDLSNRYGDYGWPATILFDENGRELAKRRGYLEPQEMTKLLETLIRNPAPEIKEAAPSGGAPANGEGLPPSLKADLQKRHQDAYDPGKGGLKTFKKSVDRDSVEYAMTRALAGDAEEAARAQKTLTAGIALIDPVWGGVYQYSTQGDWTRPHYEKLTRLQGEYLRIYALAYGLWKDPAYLKASRDIARYLNEFQRTPGGAYQTSQDADLHPGEKATEYYALDDAERRKLGIPRIDPHVYPSENGPVIQGLAALYAATNENQYRDQAVAAAEWVLKNRAVWLPGGFRHDETDAAGPYLSDTLAMGEAFLSLYAVTADRFWLKRAEESACFLRNAFETRTGAMTALPSKSLPPAYLLAEHIQLARFANLLYHYTGNPMDEADAKHALRYLSDPAVSEDSLTEAGILIADDEIGRSPTHVTVVGRKDNEDARGLFKAAIALPQPYRRIEWWDHREGAMPNPDVSYPELDRPAAFLCTNRTCSRPIFEAQDIRKTLDDLEKVK